MSLFDFLQKKKTFSNEEIEEEYERARWKVLERNLPSFNRAIKIHAEKTCFPQARDDLLAKKADFIRIYSFIARNNRIYHSLKYKKGKFKSYPLWTQKWHDYEQDERLEAQRRWREITSHTR